VAGLRATAIGGLWLLLALSAFAAPAAADDYPSRSIRLIIPFPPGGSNDVVGRIIANQLGEKLNKQVFIDNRSGAGGVVGSDLAAKATATRSWSFPSRTRSTLGFTRSRSIP
jgi:tripartite-type tricarboxylate transporter receptor subunit TctC